MIGAMAMRRVRSIPATPAITADPQFAHEGAVDWSANDFDEDPEEPGAFGYKAPPNRKTVALAVAHLEGVEEIAGEAAATVSVALVVQLAVPMNPASSAKTTMYRELEPVSMTLGDLGIEFELPQNAIRLYPRITTAPAGLTPTATSTRAFFMGDYQ